MKKVAMFVLAVVISVAFVTTAFAQAPAGTTEKKETTVTTPATPEKKETTTTTTTTPKKKEKKVKKTTTTKTKEKTEETVPAK